MMRNFSHKIFPNRKQKVKGNSFGKIHPEVLLGTETLRAQAKMYFKLLILKGLQS